MQRGLSKKLSTLLAKYFGGRFVHMVNSVTLHELYKDIGVIDDDVMYEHIIEDMFARQIRFQRDVIAVTSPFSQDLLSLLSCEDKIEKTILLDGLDSDIQALREDVITRLIKANVLRYSGNGMIRWHGKVQEREFSNM